MNNLQGFGLGRAAALVIVAAASVLGCSDDSATGPSSHLDSGLIDTGTTLGTDAAMEAATSGDDSGANGDASADAAIDSAPACISDATLCNSCSAPDADFYNACSSQVTYCVPFNNAVVPLHPPVP